MQCSKCGSELFIDHVDDNGKYWYVCMNKVCSEYRKAFNPTTDGTQEAKIKPRTSETPQLDT